MVKVDKNICIGCGVCVALCDQVFEMDKDGKAKVKKQKDLPCVDEAINQCPVGAIKK
jgi:ferredoxin